MPEMRVGDGEVDAEQAEQETQDGQPEAEHQEHAYEKNGQKATDNVHEARTDIK